MYNLVPPGAVPFPIWVVKNGIWVRRTNPAIPVVLRGREAAAPSMINGRLAFKIISAARSSEARWATGISIGCCATTATDSVSSPAMSSGNSSRTGPGRSCVAIRKASRTRVGIVEVLTICKQRVGRAGREIERARAKRCDADTGLSRQPAIGGRHEGRTLFMPGQDQLNRRFSQAFDDVEIFFAGNTEDAIDALVLKSGDQQVRAFGHPNLPAIFSTAIHS